jgi:hypothetical protein
VGAEDIMARLRSQRPDQQRVEPGPVVPGFQNAVDIVTPMSLIYTLEDERCTVY